MDKKTFDIIKGYDRLSSSLYSKLEIELGSEKADLLVSEIDRLTEKLLKLGKYSDDSNLVEQDGFLKEEYEGISRYTKVTVIYSYDNGYSLCESIDDLTLLIPTDLISHETE